MAIITYEELAKRLDAVKLFNKAPELDPEILAGLENGDMYTPCNFELVGGTKYKCIEHGDDVDIEPEVWDDDSQELPECDGKYEQPQEIFQWFLISPSDADYIKRNTDELIFYSEVLDEYVWGVTHFGTAWSHVELEFKG